MAFVLAAFVYMLMNCFVRYGQEEAKSLKWLKFRESRFRAATEALNVSRFADNHLEFEIGNLSAYLVLKLREGYREKGKATFESILTR